MLRIHDINNEYSYPATYKITNLINKKNYIGQSQNLYKRFLDYKKGRYSPHLKKAIEKYSINNFVVEIIERNVPVDMLNEREQYWIDYYGSFKKENGYNICPIAGTTRGVKKSKEEKEAMSKRASNRTGSKNPFYGKRHSNETKQKISSKNSLKKLSKDHIDKFCKAGQDASKKKVVQLSLDGKYINTWGSILEASKELMVCASSISNVINNKRKTAGGFKWELVS